jgi:hypothetical protein
MRSPRMPCSRFPRSPQILRRFAYTAIRASMSSFHFCSKAYKMRGRTPGHAPRDVERQVEPLPYRGGLPNGSPPTRVCSVHRCALRENPISDELHCPEGHKVDSWGVMIGPNLVALADRFGLVAVAPCLHPGALRDYLAAAELEAAASRPTREGGLRAAQNSRSAANSLFGGRCFGGRV